MNSAYKSSVYYVSFGCSLVLSASLWPSQSRADAITVGQTVHVRDEVDGYTLPNADTKYCSVPGAELYVVKVDDSDKANIKLSTHVEDTGVKYHWYKHKAVKPSEADGKSASAEDVSKQFNCVLVAEGRTYSIQKATLEAADIATSSLVTGVLAVPYKFHFSDHASTVGTTVGTYLGYQSDFWNRYTVTPILAGGVALISTQAATASSSSSTAPSGANSTTTTSAGFSLATGLIGTVGSSNTQLGLVVGIDWLGKKANYQYEGKPWLAFEIGYNFSISK